MGAQLWYHEVAGRNEPLAALKAVQARIIAEEYDLSALVPQHLRWAHEAVEAAKVDGDEYGLLDLYQERLELLEDLARRPIPQDPESQIDLVRQLHSDTGEGIGNILDVTGISEGRGVHVAQRLSENEVTRLAGTKQPTIEQARHAVEALHEELGRGESVCFPYFAENGTGQPMGWYFVGNTID